MFYVIPLTNRKIKLNQKHDQRNKKKSWKTWSLSEFLTETLSSLRGSRRVIKRSTTAGQVVYAT